MARVSKKDPQVRIAELEKQIEKLKAFLEERRKVIARMAQAKTQESQS